MGCLSDKVPLAITIVMQDATIEGSRVKSTRDLYYFLQHVKPQLSQNTIKTKGDIVVNMTVVRIQGNNAHSGTEPCGWHRIGT